MPSNPSIVQRDPVILAGLVETAVLAIVGALTVTEVLSETTSGAIILCVSPIIALVAYVVRGIVWSPASVNALRRELSATDA